MSRAERATRLRDERQQKLLNTDGPLIDVVLYESVQSRILCGAEIMHDQLQQTWGC